MDNTTASSAGPGRIGAEGGMRIIDLDAAAGTATTAGVRAAVMDAMSAGHGNPSSAHARGNLSRTAVGRARSALAALVPSLEEEGVTFTSGCTEANNMLLRAAASLGSRVVTCAVEHPSVLAVATRMAREGRDVIVLPVDPNGLVSPDQVAESVASDRPTLVSIQVANSETGVLQDVSAIAAACARHGHAILHCDAAQALGKVDIPFRRGLGADLLSISGHKIHAPMGVGAVLAADPGSTALAPFMLGGDQEGGRRAGTEAVPAIAGFGAACDEWLRNQAVNRQHLLALRHHLESGVRAALDGVRINGEAAPRLPNVANLTFEGCDGMALVAQLDAMGIAVSQGSACSSGRPEPSGVLRAMGLSEEEAYASIRLSMSVTNGFEEIDEVIEALARIVQGLRSRPW